MTLKSNISRTIDPKIRFYEKIIKPENTECHIWTGAKSKGGYGNFPLTWKNIIGAHRYSYILHKGEIPEGILVRHTCDNRLCVNPDHLLLGTQADNANDTFERDRTTFGEKNYMCKLTETKVIEIIKSNLSSTELSLKYDIHPRTVRGIKSGRSWIRTFNKVNNGN